MLFTDYIRHCEIMYQKTATMELKDNGKHHLFKTPDHLQQSHHPSAPNAKQNDYQLLTPHHLSESAGLLQPDTDVADSDYLANLKPKHV